MRCFRGRRFVRFFLNDEMMNEKMNDAVSRSSFRWLFRRRLRGVMLLVSSMPQRLFPNGRSGF
jgi:hypothetical protein